ncbi:MAG TPA: LysE family transporter [Candidatus Polarisedimenticolia bacterium]|nr:LysE family transporter [Candidatus Polarisedimenticolia bacterium]
MTSAFVTGAFAGAAIAIPVGAIAILIIELGIRRGFRAAAAAGLGAATADGIYATVAALGGGAVAGALAPIADPLRVAAVVALVVVGIRGLRGALSSAAPDAAEASPQAPARGSATYLRFLGLTLLNPATVIYFTALILGLPQLGSSAGERIAFAAGAFSASSAWQVALAGMAALAHRRLPERYRVALSVFGYLVIIAFALGIARDLIA